MLLFSTHITPRLRYIVEFVSKELFDEPAKIALTTDRETFAAATGPRINYSPLPIAGCFTLRPAALPASPGPLASSGPPASLLFESGVHPIEIECFLCKDQTAFFPTEGDFPFDLFSAAFYLLSRYEEYLPHPKDEYGRFPHTHSLAWREGFLDQPLINSWLQEFRSALSRRYPDLVFRYPVFKFVPTYDIDTAYSYLYKGWRRNLGGALRAIVAGRWAQVKERIAVLSGRRKDPFDVYEWLDSLHLYCRMRPYYFFLAAARQKGVDRNIPISTQGLQELIRYHSVGSRLGIHPSWQSGDQGDLLKEELEWMEYISGQKIVRSRQHYIRFTLPATYRRLLQYGIEQDFSMGYGSINGFRASVASSFYWYDLEKEEKTALRVFPFCFMDANSFYEQQHNAAGAMNELMQHYRQIRKVNGLMITIWHNSILGHDPEFAGWREVYETFLREEVFWDM
jgi:hypothetical protein